MDAYFGTCFEHLARAAETGLFDTIVHPDLVKNFAPSDWCPERAMDHILPCLDRIAALGMLQEAGYSHVSMFLHRRRQDLPIDRVQASLKAAEQTGPR